MKLLFTDLDGTLLTDDKTILDIDMKAIEEMLNENGGTLELKRNELANRMGCVPSQINYVITSRFGKDRGYIVESRRGGGGYVRITKLRLDRSSYLCHMLGAVGDSIGLEDAKAITGALLSGGFITEREKLIADSAISGTALEKVDSDENRGILRADILKSVIFGIMNFS